MPQISILGCGWFSLSLAKTLLENEFSVKGSNTSVDKLSVLTNLGIQPYLIALSKNKTSIVRLGRLIGEDRHLIKFLAGRKNIKNPNAPKKLIHPEDCTGIILKIMKRNAWNERVNNAAHFPPSRKNYYSQKAIDFGFVLPEFNFESPTFGKTILNSKSENVFGYPF
jgi:hypothetical protein